MKVLPFFAISAAVALVSVAVTNPPSSHSSVCEYQPVTEFNPSYQPATFKINVLDTKTV